MAPEAEPGRGGGLQRRGEDEDTFSRCKGRGEELDFDGAQEGDKTAMEARPNMDCIWTKFAYANTESSIDITMTSHFRNTIGRNSASIHP